jgi:hypothetical protein
MFATSTHQGETLMADRLDLTGDVALAIDDAAERGHAIVLGYIGDDGYAAISFRGSTQVHGAKQLALWARKPNEGLAKVIGRRPHVSLLYYSPEGPGPKYLSIHGHARVDASANDDVYAKMIEGERQQDPERNGVAVVIDVETVDGFGADGPFSMHSDAS